MSMAGNHASCITGNSKSDSVRDRELERFEVVAHTSWRAAKSKFKTHCSLPTSLITTTFLQHFAVQDMEQPQLSVDSFPLYPDPVEDDIDETATNLISSIHARCLLLNAFPSVHYQT
jgi:hypothetical protein